MKTGIQKALFVFLMAIVANELSATEIRGIIRSVDIEPIFDGKSLFIKVDTTGNRIPDTLLSFPDPVINPTARAIQQFAERGMEIVFDDEGAMTLRSGNKQISGYNTISIDGDNMIFLFPNERNRFKFAAAAQARQ